MFIQCEFPSRALGYPARVDILIPDGGVNKKYPVLYLLHGGDGTPWIRHTAVERYAQQAKVAVVMPFSRNTCWRRAEITFPDMAVEGPKVEDYETFFMSELRKTVTEYFPLSCERKDNYIAGLSLGGYGAAYYSTAYPECFTLAGIFSGYLFDQKMFHADRSAMTEDELMAGLTPDLVDPVKEAVRRGKQLPYFYIANGTRDVKEFSPLYADFLRENGARVETEFDKYDFGHEWDMWEICIREFLRKIARERVRKEEEI